MESRSTLSMEKGPLIAKLCSCIPHSIDTPINPPWLLSLHCTFPVALESISSLVALATPSTRWQFITSSTPRDKQPSTLKPAEDEKWPVSQAKGRSSLKSLPVSSFRSSVCTGEPHLHSQWDLCHSGVVPTPGQWRQRRHHLQSSLQEVFWWWQEVRTMWQQRPLCSSPVRSVVGNSAGHRLAARLQLQLHSGEPEWSLGPEPFTPRESRYQCHNFPDRWAFDTQTHKQSDTHTFHHFVNVSSLKQNLNILLTSCKNCLLSLIRENISPKWNNMFILSRACLKSL